MNDRQTSTAVLSMVEEHAQTSSVDVSVIVVDYYSVHFLEACISSIVSHFPLLTCEVIIVSNSRYSAAEEARLGRITAGARILRNDKNLGFAKAINTGIRKSVGRWLLLLNPDCKLLTANLDEAINYLERNPEVGILGPLLVNAEKQVQESSRDFVTPMSLLFRVWRRVAKKETLECTRSEVPGEPKSVDWVSGACMLVRRSAVDKVGLMDERYFMYVEDMDWCQAFWENGYEVKYWPKMIVQHDASRASSTSLARWLPSRLMWIHGASWIKYFKKRGWRALWKAA